ncbi:MAG: PDZ domain-containing protein, partial [Pseudolabrys sp.]
AAAEASPIGEQQETFEPRATASLEPPPQVSVEARSIIKHTESPEAPPALKSEPPVRVDTVVEPIHEHREPLKAQPAASLEPPPQFSFEGHPIRKHQESLRAAVKRKLRPEARAEVPPTRDRRTPLEAQPVASPELPAQAGAEVSPILEPRYPKPQQALSSAPPAQNGAQVQPILKRRKLFEHQPAASPDLHPPAGVEVPPSRERRELPPQPNAEDQPSLEHGERLDPVSANGHSSGNGYDRSVAKDNKAVQLDPIFAVDYKNDSVTKDESGNKVDANGCLPAPEPIQARYSGNRIKLDRPAAPNSKKTTAPTPTEESTSEDQSAANEARPEKGWLGVSLRPVTEAAAQTLNVRPDYGALVSSLHKSSPAKPAGIEPGDIVVNFDGKEINEWRDLPRIITDTPAGNEVAVTIIRKGKELTRAVKVGRPEDADKPPSFTSKESTLQEEPMRTQALGPNRATLASRDRVHFGRRRSMPALQ